jgi:hypothetical protein
MGPSVIAAARTYDKSGVFVASNGVGTHRYTASAPRNASGESVGEKRPVATAVASCASETSST